MVEYLNYYIWRNIFKYFNAMELDVASKVCSLWSRIIEDEIASRGPVCIITDVTEKESMEIWHNRIREALCNLRIKPFLQFQITENIPDSYFINGCPCSYVPTSCYSLYLNNSFVRNDCNRTISMIIPEASSLEITTRTFVTLPWTIGIFCIEQNVNSDSIFLNAKDLKEDFVNSFTADDTKNRCMILYCEQLSSSITQSFVEHFLSWFPNIKINVWGGIVDEIMVCSFMYKISLCCCKTNFVCIFINGIDMETWTLTFDDNCNNKEKIETVFADFQNNKKLKKHSMGFMYTTYRRARDFFHIELNIFKRIFPKMPLFYILGCAAFGEDLRATLGTLKNSQKKIQRKETKLMIFTYN